MTVCVVPVVVTVTVLFPLLLELDDDSVVTMVSGIVTVLYVVVTTGVDVTTVLEVVVTTGLEVITSEEEEVVVVVVSPGALPFS